MRTLLLVVGALLLLAPDARATSVIPTAPADVVAPDAVVLPTVGRLARTVAAASPCAPDPCAPKSPWSFTLGVAASLAQGNSDSFDFTADGRARYEAEPWLWELKARFAYGEKDGATSTEAYHATMHGERTISGRLYVFGNLDWDRDVPAELDYRWTALGGLGYAFIKGRTIKLKGEAGGGYTWEKRSSRAASGDPAAYLGLEYEKTWANGTKLGASYRFVPNLDDFDLTVMTWELKFSRPLCAEIDFTISLRVDHVIEPPPPAESTDVLLAVGVRANF